MSNLLHELQNTKVNSIAKVILDVIHRMGLKTENARGHCYDGAATMSGAKRGFATQMKSINEKVLYTHCYGHALNLAVHDCIRKVEVLKDAWGIIKRVYTLVKKSPSRVTKLQEIRKTTKIKAKPSERFALHDGLFTRRCVHLFSTTMKI